jgi:hypothetical protein
MLPTAEDLDDPDGFVHREQLDFSELDRMLADDDAEGRDGPETGDDRTDGDRNDGDDGRAA